MLKLLFLLCLLVVFRCCCAQGLQAPAVARTGVYGNTQNNALQMAANQAALGNLKTFSAAVYGEKTFLLQELSRYHFAFATPAGDGGIGLQIAYSGNVDFNTSKIGLAYGRHLGKTVDVGLQFSHFNQKVRGYGHAAQVTVEAGMLVHVSEELHVGFQVCNPAGVVLDKAAEKLPAICTAGFTYQPSPAFGITAEIIKTAKRPIEVQSGVEYHFTSTLWAKAGINSGTTAFFIAAGFQLRDFRIEVVGSVHPQLDLSPGMMVLYNDMGK